MSISFEENKKNEFHMHCMIGIRSLLGYNENIKINLKNILRDNYEFDCYIIETKNQTESKIKIHYCFKKCFEYAKYNSFIFIRNRQEIFADLIDFLNSTLIEEDYANLGGIKQNNILDDLDGLKKIEEEKDKNIILNL